MKRSQVVLAAKTPEHQGMSAHVIAPHIAAGERAASAALPALRRLLA